MDKGILLCLSVLITGVYRRLALTYQLVDIPNYRSLHTQHMPRGAGLVMMLLLSGWFGWQPYLLPASGSLMVGLWLIALISFCDDIFTVRARYRFLAQLIAVILLLSSCLPGRLDFGFMNTAYLPLVILFTGLASLWLINLFNFMDGLDGFAGSQGLFLTLSYGSVLLAYGANGYAMCLFALAALLMGYLIWNLPPAKVFMGDVGSTSLGFLTFGIAIIGQTYYQIPIIYFLMLNGLFIFDATVTLIRRFINQEPVYLPHCKHAFQRLHLAGISNRQILIGQLCLNVLIFGLLKSLPLLWAVSIEGAMITAVYAWIEVRSRQCTPSVIPT